MIHMLEKQPKPWNTNVIVGLQKMFEYLCVYQIFIVKVSHKCWGCIPIPHIFHVGAICNLSLVSWEVRTGAQGVKGVWEICMLNIHFLCDCVLFNTVWARNRSNNKKFKREKKKGKWQRQKFSDTQNKMTEPGHRKMIPKSCWFQVMEKKKTQSIFFILYQGFRNKFQNQTFRLLLWI